MEREEARVTVSVRVRPKLTSAVNALQQSERYEEVICIPTSDATLRLAERRASKVPRNMHFAYDHVFDVDTTQEEVYEAAALDGVDSVLSGTSASFLTYGQTGSGKTYTVLGKTAQPAPDAAEAAEELVGPDTGLLLRAIQDMLSFAERMCAKGERHVVLGITAIEIYNDEIRDLLRDNGGGGGVGRAAAAPLQPIMTRDALHFPGLTHLPLRALKDACALYERAANRRVQRATSANDASSRSHAIFTVEVFQVPASPQCPCAPTLAECCAVRDAQVTATARGAATATAAALPSPSPSPSPPRCDSFDGAPTVLRMADGSPLLCSALTVADLAGSEKAKHADVHGTGFDELRRINASLTALGNVVHHLYHGSAHVPYRDSKLTMVLRDTFAAPRARVVLFVNVSPTALTCEETLSSLYFADKMKNMTVPDTAATPQQAALQSSFLTSLRTHDALLADLHIFQVQQELAADTLWQRRVADAAADAGHAVLSLPYNTPRGDEQAKAHQLQQLCATMRAEVAQAETPEARQSRHADIARRAARKELLMAYSLRRADTHRKINAAEQEHAALMEEFAQAETAMRATLRAAKAAVQETVAARQKLDKAKAAQVASLKDLDVAAAGASPEHDDLEGSTNADVDGHGSNNELATRYDASPKTVCSFAEQTERFDDVIGHTLKNALAAAQLRNTFVELIGFNVRTDPAPALPPSDNRSGSHRSEKSRSRGSTAGASLDTKAHGTVEGWLRGAVLAMVGNAVVQSAKRRAASSQQQQPQLNHRTPLHDVTNVLSPSASSWKSQQLPKFWKVAQEASQARQGTAKENAADAAAAVAQTAKRLRSAFDDPALFTRVTAYMDMGASLVKIDRTGHPRPRWFYLAQREDRFLLCWDESRRAASLRGGGHVYLDAVVKLTLGRSSPGFLKYAKTSRDAVAVSVAEGASTHASTEEEVCNSFTIVYHTRASHREFKFVDIICPNKSALETWVMGLAHWTGVSPIYEDARQPDDGEAATPLVAMPGTTSDPSADSDTPPASALTPQEAVLCRAWHIPSEVLRKTKREIEARRARHQSGKMRLTPGELRDLTGLDIFRASALWRCFEREGLVANPTRQLCCFVEDTQTLLSAQETEVAAA